MSATQASPDAAVMVQDEYRLQRWIVVGLGLLLPLFYLWRVQAGGDQLKLLLLGWEFYVTGEPPPYGTVLSHGGLLPGSLTGLLVGLPLYISESYRLVNLSTLCLHVLGWVILDTTLRGVLSPRARLLYAILYWLNPWRVYHSLFLWNPNWVFFFAAVHFWTLMRQRREAGFVASFVQVMSATLLFQLQASFLVLVILSVLLWLRGYQRVHWGGIVVGVLVSIATLWPWLQAVVADPHIRPAQGGYIGRGFLKGNLFRTVLYWIRLSSFHYSSRMMDYDFSPDLGATAQAWLGPILRYFNLALGILSALVVAVANVRLWRIGKPPRFGRIADGFTDREWLVGVTRWGLVATALTWSLSPVTAMHYQILVVFHLAVLPLVFWLEGDALAPVFPRVWKSLVLLFAFFIVVQGIASPMYRKGGHDPFFVSVRHPFPMLDRIGIEPTGIVSVDPEDGLVPDMIWLSETNHRVLSPDEMKAAIERAQVRMKELERRIHEKDH